VWIAALLIGSDIRGGTFPVPTHPCNFPLVSDVRTDLVSRCTSARNPNLETT